jgi:hypothetical protein
VLATVKSLFALIQGNKIANRQARQACMTDDGLQQCRKSTGHLANYFAEEYLSLMIKKLQCESW